MKGPLEGVHVVSRIKHSCILHLSVYLSVLAPPPQVPWRRWDDSRPAEVRLPSLWLWPIQRHTRHPASWSRPPGSSLRPVWTYRTSQTWVTHTHTLFALVSHVSTVRTNLSDLSHYKHEHILCYWVCVCVCFSGRIRTTCPLPATMTCSCSASWFSTPCPHTDRLHLHPLRVFLLFQNEGLIFHYLLKK